MKLLRKFKRFINKNNLSPANNRRLVGVTLFGITILVFIVFVVRFSWIVGTGKVANVSLDAKTKELYQGSEPIYAKRGSILDRYGNPIAEDATSYSVFAIISEKYVGSNKEKLYIQEKDFSAVASVLKKYLDIDEADTLKRLTQGHNNKQFQVEFGNKGKNINLSKKQAIEKELKDQKIKGIGFDSRPSRSYPNGQFASHFIGMANLNENNEAEGLKGVLGLEAAYDDILSGKDGKQFYEKDSAGNPLPGTSESTIPAKDGQDIYTTLDVRLQNYMESLMDETNEKYTPKSMTAVLMEAKTGDIVALSQRPTFNPDTKAGFDNEDVWPDRIVGDQFEPGSTMKVITTAASVNEGQFNPNDTYTAGETKVYDTEIHDHDWSTRGAHPLTYLQALTWSSNVGMVHLEQGLGEKLTDYQIAFGFGRSTNSGLTSEQSGTLAGDNPVDKAMSSFGQAMFTTDFQMMKAFSAIANQGAMLQPHYISKIVNPDNGQERVSEPEVVGHPIRPETANTLLEYMVGVVEDPQWGSAYSQKLGRGLYAVPGVRLSAKTGTAQIGSQTSAGYLGGDTDYVYSVAIVAPTDDPKYVLYVTMKQPKPGTSKDDLLGPFVNTMLKLALEVDGGTLEAKAGVPEEIKIVNYKGEGINTSCLKARREILDPIIVGDGTKVAEQSTKAGNKLLPNQKLMFRTTGNMTMPDVIGWTRSDLEKLEKLMNIKLELNGDGVAKDQSIVFNAKVNEGDTLKINLSN
ncbi:MAG: cell division protein FtsI [Lactobacillales bacterium]|jgi:penicillin-binding protein 2X|nr:cell division protein FtsI [Lactobacillales bacterium]